MKRTPRTNDPKVRAPGRSLIELTERENRLGSNEEKKNIPRNEKAMLNNVALREKQSSVSICEEQCFAQYFLLFDRKEKNVNVDKSKKDGWLRNVLSPPGCHVEQQAMMKPGKVERVKVKIEKWMKVNGLLPDTYVKRSMVLLKRTKRQARKMRKKRSVRKPLRGPSSLRTLQGPTLRTLAMPQLAEKREVR